MIEGHPISVLVEFDVLLLFRCALDETPESLQVIICICNMALFLKDLFLSLSLSLFVSLPSLFLYASLCLSVSVSLCLSLSLFFPLSRQ